MDFLAAKPLPRFLRSSPLCVLLGFMLSLAACSPGRQPIPAGVVPSPKRLTQADEQYGRQVLQELTEKYPLDYNHPRSNEVRSIVDRLTRAAHADSDPWQVYVLRDAQFKNAAATRGNHVFIWTGIMDSAHSEGELATILAHEISHVLAGHTEPDPSEQVRQMVVGLGAMAAGVAASYATQGTILGGSVGDLASGLTQEVGNGILTYPQSRANELEADRVGLLLLADAGYDPQSAIDFWSRAVHDPDFSASLPFLSSHPPAEERLAQLEQLLPAARERAHLAPPSGPGPLGSNPAGSHTAPSVTAAPHRTVEARPVRLPEPPPSGQSGRNDTFAVTLPPPSTSGLGPPYAAEVPQEYRVLQPRTILYDRSSVSSHQRGEFSEGALLRGTPAGPGWIHVELPDRGYLRSTAVRPTKDEQPTPPIRTDSRTEPPASSGRAY